MSIGSKIYTPSEIIDYSSMIITNYEKTESGPSVMTYPFVGFKILMTDDAMSYGDAAPRMKYLDQHVGKILIDTGCFLRETNNDIMPNGFWLISLPVPLYHLHSSRANQIERIVEALEKLGRIFNINFSGRVEINVSGRCTVADTEFALNNVMIPPEDMALLIRPQRSAYNLGKVIRINDLYMLVRTTWDLTHFMGNYHALGEKLLSLSYNISTLYR